MSINGWNGARVRRVKKASLQSAVLGLSLLVGAGCKTTVPGSQPSVRSDQQVVADIQAKISAESALNGQNVQIAVQGGVATLNGSVTDNASRALAANDAGTVNGVRTVINNLVIEPPPSSAALQQPVGPQEQQLPQAHYDYKKPHTGKHSADAQYPPDATNQQPGMGSQDQQAQSPQTEPTTPTAEPAAAPAMAPAPPPPPPPTPVNVTIQEGTTLPIRITEALDSAQTQTGDVFHGTLAEDLVVNGMVAMSRGASVMGKVVDARDAAHFKGSSLLSIELTSATVHGRQVPLVTEAYSKQGQARGKNTAEKTGGGAVLGGLIGAIAGGGKGAAIGAAAGGGIGAGTNGVTRGQQVQIAPETIVNFRLQSPVTVMTSRKVGAPRGDERDSPEPALQPRQ